MKSNNIFYNEYLIEYIQTHQPYHPTLLCSDKENDKVSDIEMFWNLCRYGSVYEFFSLKLFKSCDSEHRKIAKSAFISTLFGQYDQKSKGKQQFAAVFPELSALLDGFKRFMKNKFDEHFDQGLQPDLKDFIYSKNKGKKSSYDAGNDYLVLVLQRIESHIFIENILKTLQSYGYDVIPRHDSILCKKSEQEAVKKIIEKEMSKIINDD